MQITLNFFYGKRAKLLPKGIKSAYGEFSRWHMRISLISRFCRKEITDTNVDYLLDSMLCTKENLY